MKTQSTATFGANLLVAIWHQDRPCCRLGRKQEDQLLDFLDYRFEQDLQWIHSLLRTPPPPYPAHFPPGQRRERFDKRKAIHYKQQAAPEFDESLVRPPLARLPAA
jgi:hypothetical protein